MSTPPAHVYPSALARFVEVALELRTTPKGARRVELEAQLAELAPLVSPHLAESAFTAAAYLARAHVDGEPRTPTSQADLDTALCAACMAWGEHEFLCK